MRFALVEGPEVEREWPRLAAILASALAHDPAGVSLTEIKERIAGGTASVVVADGDGVSGALVYQLFEEDGELCCFASYLAGKVEGGPRQMIATMRRLMGAFEEASRAAGVTQVFIGGRDWGRVFPDYELTGDVPNRRRKRL